MKPLKQKEINPFRTSLAISASLMYTINSGNVRQYEVERAQPASVFMDDNLLRVTSQLTSSAKDMVFYILRYLGSGKETIELNYETYAQRMGGIGARTFKRAKEELRNLLIIEEKSRKNVYFINPLYFFRGNRLKAYPEAVHFEYIHPNITKLVELGVLPDRTKVVPESALDEEPL